MLAALFGVLVILFPTVITGVCMLSTMPCVHGTKPALIMIGFCMILLGCLGIFIPSKVS
jgi:hypothetical protein